MLCRENLQKKTKEKIFSNGARARYTDPGSAFEYSPLGMCFLDKEYKKAYIALQFMIGRMEITQLLIQT